jgi:hypothetical protein
MTFQCAGIGNAPKKVQFKNFSDTLAKSGDLCALTCDTWREAFIQLRNCLEARLEDGKKIVFLDEISWMKPKNPAS